MVRPPTREQVSAGGVAFRSESGQTLVALISVGPTRRWQLPKGRVDPPETPVQAALREVREEAGIETEVLAPIETIAYWYQARERGTTVRFRKQVHFYLVRYLRGDVADHDDEVNEARWVEIGEAQAKLAFASERRVLIAARAAIASLASAPSEAAPTPEGGK